MPILLLIIFILYFSKKNKNILRKAKTLLLILVTTIMVFYIILFPRDIIEASQKGIHIWFSTVLPSLLPFFIGAELLIGLGVVKFIGVLIEPVIRPIFRVPGEASFVFAMSITSGYPMGAKLTSSLRRDNTINKIEAQRMIAFCSTSGPLFMIGAVAIGMLHNEVIGPYIALAHYLGAITVGFIFRFYEGNHVSYYNMDKVRSNVIKKAFKEMLEAKELDGRTFGKLLSDSVKESISTIILIGGFIVVFSVIIKELSLAGVFDYLYFAIGNITNSTLVTKDLIKVLATGIIEITMGCKIASESISLAPTMQIVLSTMIISWSGLSIHAQVLSLTNDTDINLKIYIFSKFIHSIISGIYMFVILSIMGYETVASITQTFSQDVQKIIKYSWMNKLLFSAKMFLVIISSLVLAGMIISIIQRKTSY
ncbi:MAG: hypothetical protein PWQ37_1075 [Candidatus Petromonas sp.]|jgi:sporulation integral membrane protein YlbJ|nr:hypothetical protein [Candidatus Petromonas sp.]